MGGMLFSLFVYLILKYRSVFYTDGYFSQQLDQKLLGQHHYNQLVIVPVIHVLLELAQDSDD